MARCSTTIIIAIAIAVAASVPAIIDITAGNSTCAIRSIVTGNKVLLTLKVCRLLYVSMRQFQSRILDQDDLDEGFKFPYIIFFCNV